MSRLRNSIYLMLIVALIAAPLAFSSRPAAAQTTYTCLPSCETNDARFLSLAGVGLSTVADQPIILFFGAPAASATLEIGIFDGETGGQWDLNTTDSRYTLFTDPELTGTGGTAVTTRLGSTMADNDWTTFTINNIPEARSPSGNYFYRLEITPVVLGTSYWSNFKVRTDSVVMLVARPFSYVAPLMTSADVNTVYPNYPNLTPTTYNGRFDFHVYMPQSVRSFTTWDGDSDFGSFDLASNDTDDFNTPNNVKPLWADPVGTNFEGVAVGVSGTTGNPSDDTSFNLFRRSPSVVYNVILPDGRSLENLDPSGNIEWERFVISSEASDQPDKTITGLIPSGLYNIHALGVDLSNLNAWKLPYQVVPVCPVTTPGTEPDPCEPVLFPYLIGDTVFQDPNGNGVQDAGEAGIPGVTVHLIDSNGLAVNDINGNPISTTTNASGQYFFNVPGRTLDLYTGEVILDGIFTVEVGAENFNAGGPLAGTTSTTGGEELTRTVIDDNVLTYDFGYRQPPPPPTPYKIGDTVFNDPNGNGVQDLGEAGIPGVVVYLLDANGQPTSDNNGQSSATTDGTGTYSFDVFPGTYSVRVGAENFNLGGPLVGATSTTGGEVLTRTVTDADVLTYDFGYKFPPSVCVVTPGIWRTTFKDQWPVDSITVAGVTYTREEAIRIMSSPVKYDMTYQLFAQVVATKLNILNGNPSSCIDAAVETAETWLMSYPLGSGVILFSPAWRSIMFTFKDLDNYNKGRLCAKPCVITPPPPPVKPPKPIKVEPVTGH
jgi:hypothetical protein